MTLSYNFILFHKNNINIFFSGICIALAALYNETTIFVGIAGLGLVVLKNRDTAFRSVTIFSIGQILIYLINAVLLTYCHCWNNYIIDMIHIGAGSRYHSFIHGIITNFSATAYGLRLFWLFIFLSFLFHTIIFKGNYNKFLIKYYIIPTLIGLTYFVNSTKEYHIIILLPFLTIFSVEFIFNTSKLLFKKENGLAADITFRAFPHLPLKILLVLLCSIIFRFIFFVNGPAIIYEYKDYLAQSRFYWEYLVNGKGGETDEHTLRIVNLANSLVYNTVSTVSQWPTLFLLKHISFSNPFIEDLTLPGNSGGMFNLSDFLDYLEANPADLLVHKTYTSWGNSGDRLNEILNKKYICLANFEKNGDSRYRDRLYYRKFKFLESYIKAFEQTKKLEDVGTLKHNGNGSFGGLLDISNILNKAKLNNNQYYIVEVWFNDSENISDASLQSGFNQTLYLKGENPYSNLYILTKPDKKTILSYHSNQQKNIANIQVYKQKEEM
jgi:hypothetical protein